MKRTLLTKLMLLLCALIVGSGSVWATEGDILSETFTSGLPSGWSSDAKGGGSTTGASQSDTNGRNDSKCWKLGTNSNPYGSITTSALSISGDATLTFWTKAKSKKTPVLLVTGTNCTLSGDYQATAASDNTYKQFTVNITNVSGSVTLTFKHNSPSSGSYIYLDDIVITSAAPTTYSVTYAANGGSGTMTDSGSPYAAGAEVTLLSNTFTAPSGKQWSSWAVTDASSNPVTVTNGKFTMPSSNVTVTAQWADITHALTYSATNGSIGGVVYGTSTAVASGASVAESGKVTLTATPDDGYTFTGWSVSGTNSSLSSTSTNPTTFTMGTANATVTANFEATATTYDITKSATNGTISTKVGESEVTKAAAGATVSLTATPNTGYSFSSWTVTDEDEGSVTVTSNQFTMPAKAVTVSASFKKTKHSITLAAENGAATIKVGNADAKDMEDGDEETDIEYGTSVTMTAIAGDGYIFSGWEVEGVDITDEQAATSPLTFTLPDDDVTVTANYAVKHTVTYYIAGEENVTYRAHGATLSLDDPDAQSGKPFYKWSSTNTPANPTWVENTATVTSDMTVYAMFTKKDATYEYRLVESNQDDWAGDYLIAYSSAIFADGRKGGTGTDAIGAQNVSVDPDDKLSGKVVDGTWGDTYKVSIEYYGQVNSKRAYLLKTQDGKYNYQSSNSNGLTATETRATAGAYAFNVTFTSSSDVKLCLTGGAAGAVFRYNTSGYFRFYKNGGQSAVYLYKRTLSSAAEYTNAEPVYYGITVDDDIDNGSIEASVTSAKEMTTITLTATPASGYGLKTWTVTDEVEVEVTGANTATFEMPAKAVSVTATFERIYATTFYSKGASVSTANYFEGDDVVFPDDPAATGNMKFMGWSETDIDYSQDSEPTLVDEKTMGTAALNFYAVFRYVKRVDNGTDELTRSLTGVTNGSTNYTSWSGKSDNTSAVYAGESAGNNNSIQLRNQSAAGIVTTSSGGYAKKVTIDWNSNTSSPRKVTIYGKNSAYSGSSDLYDDKKMGTSLGEIEYGKSTELTITSDYKFIGIKASGALYANSVSIKWEGEELGNYGTEFVETTVNLNSADNSSSPKYYTTLYTDKKFIVPDDNMVATVDGVNGSKLQFNYYTKGQIVPANTGVVIVQTETGNFVCNYSNGEATTHSNNKLHGSLEPYTTTNVGGVTTGYKFYKMSRNADGGAYSVGFYWGADEGAAFTMKTAGKCWLALPNNSDIRGFAFGEDVVSGVEGFDAYLSTDSNKYYDLQGRRVLQPQKGQLYIVNGKKVLY